MSIGVDEFDEEDQAYYYEACEKLWEQQEMEKLFVLLAAIALVILGARGTYKSVWNQFFPNEQIVTTPTSTTGSSGSSSSSGGGSAYNPKGGQPGQTPTTPVQVGQQAANVTKSIISGLAGNSGGSNTAHTVPAPGGVYPVESVGRTQQTVVNTGVPSWWPSFLPYPSWFPHPGEGQTGISIPNPFAP